MGKILFHYNIDGFKVRESKMMKRALADIFKNEKKIFSRIDFVFCDNDYLIQINRKFLKHDFFTDIITFDLGENDIVGEIYISIEMIRFNAVKFGSTFKNELSRVMSHGIFHLCGYGDKTKTEKLKMTSKENSFLKSLKFSST